MTRVTVCVCTHDRPAYARACLDALRAQTVPPERFCIVVVDSFSCPAAAAELRALTAAMPNARLIRLDRPGISAARNAGARAAGGGYVAYVDDDAIAAPDWVEMILRALEESTPPPALIGGRILPIWEAALPSWWPRSLRGVLSIIETEGAGEYRGPDVPRGLEPYAVNLVVEADALIALGGFDEGLGRAGQMLLSDEEVQLAWRLQAAGRSTRYDSRILVRHQVQAARLQPGWLLSRMYWQGVSSALTARTLGQSWRCWLRLPRRLAVIALTTPAAWLVPAEASRLIGLRWRRAYSLGMVRGTFAAVASPRLRPPGNPA